MWRTGGIRWCMGGGGRSMRGCEAERKVYDQATKSRRWRSRPSIRLVIPVHLKQNPNPSHNDTVHLRIDPEPYSRATRGITEPHAYTKSSTISAKQRIPLLPVPNLTPNTITHTPDHKTHSAGQDRTSTTAPLNKK